MELMGRSYLHKREVIFARKSTLLFDVALSVAADRLSDSECTRKSCLIRRAGHIIKFTYVYLTEARMENNCQHIPVRQLP
jgi:hypothetical protein